MTRGARSAATRSNVEVPAPTVPTNATTSPAATSSDTSRSAGALVAGYQNVTRSSVSRTT